MSKEDSEATALDWAKLNLDSMTAAVDARVKLMKACADYDYRMEEVLEKRIKVEQDKVTLRKMKDALADFQRARSRLQQEIRNDDRKVSQIGERIKDARKLERGEDLDPDFVADVWIGFNFLLSNAPIAVAAALNNLKITSEHRNGEHYSHNRDAATCESAPPDITHVRRLIEFFRKRNYVPRLGSPPYCLLFQVLAILDGVAQANASYYVGKLEAAKGELDDLRTADWKTIDIDRTPKDTKDAEDDQQKPESGEPDDRYTK